MVSEQLDIFDLMYEDFKYDTTRPIRIIELFAGIGTQRMAFDKLGIDYEVVAISEVDKFAILSYAIIHTNYLDVRDTYFDTHTHTPLEMATVLQKKNVGINFKTMKHTINENTNIETLRDYFLADKLSGNLGDISKVKGIDMPKTIDLMTYSFPCTDLSKAGKQEGLSNTRSGLVYEVFRIVEELKEINNKPTTLLMENVIDLIQSKFVKEFNEMQKEVEELEYINYNFVMNAKDYGVAQNRERVFMVSLPLKSNYRKPVPIKLEKRLKDYLEEEVDESYYLSDKQVSQISSWKSQQNPIENAKTIDDEHMQCLTAKGNTSMNASMLLIKEATKKGYDEAFEGDSVTLDQPNSKTRRGRVGNGIVNTLTTSCNNGVVVSKKNELCNKMIANGHLKESDMIRHSYTNERMENVERTESSNGISATLTTRPDTLGIVVKDDSAGIINPLKGKTNRGWHFEQEIYNDKGITRALKAGGGSGNIPKVVEKPPLRIRKLTPRECWRLMGIDDSYFDKANGHISNSQLYKQAGNAIVVNVIYYIIKSMI